MPVIPAFRINTSIRCHHILVRMTIIEKERKKKKTKCWQGCEEKNEKPLNTVGRNVSYYSHMENNMEVPKNT
jgi:transcription elongation factor Elf1